MMYLDKRISVMLIGPKRAGELLEYAYENQRPLREEKVRLYAEAMKRGEFKPAPIEVHCLDGRCYLTDGQHRLRAIIRAGIEVEQFYVEYDAVDMTTIHEAYRRTDVGATRSIGNLLHTVDDLRRFGIPPSHLTVVSTGALFLMNGCIGRYPQEGLSPYERSLEYRIRAIEYWGEEARTYFSQLGNPRPLVPWRNAALMAVALPTLRFQPEKALAFFSRVFQNRALEEKTGEWHLFRLLVEGQRSQGADVFTRRIAACWNFSCRGGTYRGTSVRREDDPLELVGTPYKGRAHIKLNYEA